MDLTIPFLLLVVFALPNTITAQTTTFEPMSRAEIAKDVEAQRAARINRELMRPGGRKNPNAAGRILFRNRKEGNTSHAKKARLAGPRFKNQKRKARHVAEKRQAPRKRLTGPRYKNRRFKKP